jgi:L-ribulokinase
MSAGIQATIGVDFGTSSVRSVVVDTATGVELGEGEFAYRQGVDGVVTVPGEPHLARQSARDYLDGLTVSIFRFVVHWPRPRLKVSTDTT